ncbi:MAG TPA: glycerophosphodiester phosphodiesterase [Actinoplanes sp.]|nr:glycerophosphodiester phosphodiesterase [Actinoplanes sp.]
MDYVSTAPLVIGHRGACGYRPEHTLESYRLAIRMGADYIEPDLVSTRDGVLVARHENEISTTTDVADRAEFAGRRTTKVIDGRTVTGWFTEDLTSAELRTLRAKERLPGVRPQNTLFDGRYPIPTFQEIIDLVSAEERRLGRPIGIYPETKQPSYFASIGLPLEEPLVAALHRNGFADRADRVLIQSFEVGSLRRLRRMTDLRLIQLLDSAGEPGLRYAGMATPAGLATIAEYAYGIGADKDLLVPRDDTGSRLPTRPIVSDAHAAGLVVHAWTFRAENRFLAPEFRLGTDADARGDGIAEYELFFDLGVDGVFSDHPDTAAGAVNAVRRHRQPVTVA